MIIDFEVTMSLFMESPPGARTTFKGREMDYFAGTGYLGLQAHPEVIQAGLQAMQKYGVSTATSRGGYGEHPVYDEFEREARGYFGAEKVLYFASGYLGASVLTQATMKSFDHIFIDSSAHYSLWDAAHATNYPITPFHHLRPDSLAEQIRAELRNHKRPLVLSDGVFPVSGEIAPVPDYVELIRPFDGLVYLDDAHALGVIGEKGWGTPEIYSIDNARCRTSGTLAKALGGFGGVIWGSSEWINEIDRNSRICVGASPPPLSIAAASARALAIARMHPELREHLWKNVERARQGLRELGWDLPDTPIPILCLESRKGIVLERIRTRLFEQDIAVEIVRSYSSTPAGGAIRIAIFATHTYDQIDRLVEAIRKLI
jgi:8-amino-7-oxononanoate synthase